MERVALPEQPSRLDKSSGRPFSPSDAADQVPGEAGKGAPELTVILKNTITPCSARQYLLYLFLPPLQRRTPRVRLPPCPTRRLPRQSVIRGARRAAEKFKRQQVIVDYLNRGVSVAEIAARIGVGETRMRAVIRDPGSPGCDPGRIRGLARRMPGPPKEFAAIQISRLNEALLVAFSAMSPTNLKAVDRVVRIVRELDRYCGFCVAQQDLTEPDRLEAPVEGSALNLLGSYDRS